LTPWYRQIGIASLLAEIGRKVPTALLPGRLTRALGVPAAALGLIEDGADACAGAAQFGGRARSRSTGGLPRTVAV
jgi:hypothetical protein